VLEHRYLHEDLAAGLEHARELGEVAEDDIAPWEMLQDEVTDEHVRDAVLRAVELLARDGAELDTRVGERGAGALEHRLRDIERKHLVEALGERAGHPAGPAADLDARSTAGIGAKSAEERFQLLASACRVADVQVGILGECVPGLPRSHAGQRTSV